MDPLLRSSLCSFWYHVFHFVELHCIYFLHWDSPDWCIVPDASHSNSFWKYKVKTFFDFLRLVTHNVYENAITWAAVHSTSDLASHTVLNARPLAVSGLTSFPLPFLLSSFNLLRSTIATDTAAVITTHRSESRFQWWWALRDWQSVEKSIWGSSLHPERVLRSRFNINLVPLPSYNVKANLTKHVRKRDTLRKLLQKP